MTATPSHLGGHFGITNSDPITLGYLAAHFDIRSMLDVGCGPGGMLDLARKYGIIALGVDGDPAMERPDVIIHDYAHAPLFMVSRSDLIWCVEFVEHIEAQYIPHFLATFRCGRVLFLTHALPGQGGHHHVNEQPAEYWIAILQAEGWQLDQEATDWVRANAGNQYTKATGMVWVRGAA